MDPCSVFQWQKNTDIHYPGGLIERVGESGVRGDSQGQFLKTALQNNEMNVLSSLGNFTIGKLHTGTHHEFSKKKKKKKKNTKHISPPPKKKPAALQASGCTAPALRGNPPQPSLHSIASSCSALSHAHKNEMGDGK